MIKLTNISKLYKLYKHPSDRLKEALHPLKKKYHKDFFALKKLSFHIKKGEVVGILGKNGSGKSTTLKIISGVLTQSSGECKVNGKITALLELGAGFNPELTGEENIYLSASIMGYSQKEIKNKFKQILAFSELGEFIYQPIKTYSSGMKARLGFSLAINVKPEVLIIDEALSVGDAAFQRKCYAQIEHMCKDNEVTVLFVSHSSSIIKQLCSRAIMLHNGEKIIEGSAKDVVNLYDKFMGSSQIKINEIKEEYKKLKNKRIASLPNKKINQDSFNETLISKSKTSYKINGAEISNVKVLNMDDIECNILNFGDTYQYSYNVTFHENIQNVKLAMFLKTTTGIEISGQGVELKEKSITSVNAGETYLIKWKFTNKFNEGYYFFNCGVNSTNYGVKIVHHRIIDAYMFKSIRNKKTNSKGIIDLGIELTTVELQK